MRCAASTAVNRMPVRRGLELRWGLALDLAAIAPADAPRVAFQLEPTPGCLRTHRGELSTVNAPAPSGFSVEILLSPATADEMLAADPSAGAAALRRFIAGHGPGFEHPLSARAHLAVESIQRCPFVGVCRTMALTARCHDLLVECLTAWSAALQPAPVTTPNATTAVHLAAEILERDLEHSPALADLAGRVGLSETTLKRAFPRVFGLTVFGYLRRRRMEAARRLLEAGTATVLEAAAAVGYSNPSNFAAAFRREFGLNPKSHQLANRAR
ncbi:helix-turn-helix transcriptional regulator [Actomonas aquatica]|uniref:AraC family transcriptional regulator n=1 Tax=Actomonas aquatica TaxID=2866162 RepID=A0ABZ1C692_9BACT|nr:AraC family transcriptional regulator [Opitutus sp. WL0086]WRQ86898.1 AraC family transcriptional regulator [Opitutus sp. WL0086]